MVICCHFPGLISSLYQTLINETVTNLNEWSSSDTVNLKYFTTENELVAYYQAQPGSLWGGIILDEDSATSTLRYTLRLNNSFTPFLVTAAFFQVGLGELWNSNGLLTLQLAIEEAFITLSIKNTSNFQITPQLQKYPFAINLGSYMAFSITSSVLSAYIPLLIVFLLSLMKEKLERVKETMKMMGMSEGIYQLRYVLDIVVQITEIE